VDLTDGRTSTLLPTQYIFNHFAKTGGTSLLAICRDNLGPAEISPHLDDHEIRLSPGTRFENYRLIAGHFSLLTQMGFCRDRYSMTLLREPIKRIFSSYTFCRALPVQNLLTSTAKELPFADFVRYFKDSPLVIHNPYCHHFAGIGKDCPEYPTNANVLLEAAKHNLAGFNFVGLCEEFERSVRLLCHELSWHVPSAVPHENRSSSDTSFGAIDRQTMEVLRGRNELDSELYEYAVDIFHSREAVVAANSLALFPHPVEPRGFAPLPDPSILARRAIIQSVSATWLPDQSSRTLEIEVDFTTTAPIGELSLGVLVTDANGRIVWGVNTGIENLPLDYDVGRNSCAAFLMECELPEGEYSITVALSEQRRLGFHEHWIDHAELFTVAPTQASVSHCAYSVTLRWFWSTLSQEQNESRPPWRCGSESTGQFEDRRTSETNNVGREASQATRSLPPYLMDPRHRFHAQGFIDVDAKISNPRVRIKLAHDWVDTQYDNRRRVYVTVTNLGNQTLSSRYVLPVNLGYYWLSGDGKAKQSGGLRSSLLFDILPGCSTELEVTIDPPPDFSSTLLCITLVQENVFWFDDCDSDSRLVLRIDGGKALAV
jgi:hypothetical protein